MVGRGFQICLAIVLLGAGAVVGRPVVSARAISERFADSDGVDVGLFARVETSSSNPNADGSGSARSSPSNPPAYTSSSNFNADGRQGGPSNPPANSSPSHSGPSVPNSAQPHPPLMAGRLPNSGPSNPRIERQPGSYPFYFPSNRDSRPDPPLMAGRLPNSGPFDYDIPDESPRDQRAGQESPKDQRAGQESPKDQRAGQESPRDQRARRREERARQREVGEQGAKGGTKRKRE